MDINSLPTGTNFAFSEGNAAIDVNRQDNVVEENENVKQDASNEKLIEIDLYEQNQVKANLENADNKESQDIEAAVAEVSEFLQGKTQDLSFSFDDESNRSIIKVTDSHSGDVIRQIPSEDVLKLSERIKELQSDIGESIGLGVLLNNEV